MGVVCVCVTRLSFVTFEQHRGPGTKHLTWNKEKRGDGPWARPPDRYSQYRPNCLDMAG